MSKKLFSFRSRSISRIFITYTFVTFFSLVALLLWLMEKTYSSYVEIKKLEIEHAISEIELSFIGTLNYAESIMDHIGKRAGVSDGRTKEINEILGFFSQRNGNGDETEKNTLSISMFSWANTNKLITVNSEYGLIKRPYDVSKRDYLVNTERNPWTMHIGFPLMGLISGQEIIPAAFGVENLESKKYIGAVVVGFTVSSFTERLKAITKNSFLDFAILDKNGAVILESADGIFSEDQTFLSSVNVDNIGQYSTFSRYSPFKSQESYLISKPTNKHSYYIVVGYPNSIITVGLAKLLWPYFLGFAILLLLFFSAWYALRVKIINPIIQLSKASKLIVQDRDDEVIMPESEVIEIVELTEQLRLIEIYKINLLQAKKSQERFFANMSHELRTPLNGILNFSLMMQKEMLGKLDEDYKEMAGDIYSSGSHLLNLVNDILDFSKMDIGKMKLREEEFYIAEEVSGALKIVTSDIDKYGCDAPIKITSEIENGVSKFFGDRRMFKQILLNLLSNASKFIEKGSIKLRLFINDKKDLILEVVDTGIGIKAEDLAKLAVEFGQVGDGYSRGKRQGSGLGLFLVKKMAELHQGKLEIFSIYGEGTTVKITFPQNRIL